MKLTPRPHPVLLDVNPAYPVPLSGLPVAGRPVHCHRLDSGALLLGEFVKEAHERGLRPVLAYWGDAPGFEVRHRGRVSVPRVDANTLTIWHRA